jgi:hypothetical protein
VLTNWGRSENFRQPSRFAHSELRDSQARRVIGALSGAPAAAYPESSTTDSCAIQATQTIPFHGVMVSLTHLVNGGGGGIRITLKSLEGLYRFFKDSESILDFRIKNKLQLIQDYESNPVNGL